MRLYWPSLGGPCRSSFIILVTSLSRMTLSKAQPLCALVISCLMAVRKPYKHKQVKYPHFYSINEKLIHHFSNLNFCFVGLLKKTFYWFWKRHVQKMYIYGPSSIMKSGEKWREYQTPILKNHKQEFKPTFSRTWLVCGRYSLNINNQETNITPSKLFMSDLQFQGVL